LRTIGGVMESNVIEPRSSISSAPDFNQLKCIS
jgi:hypothetical protein